MSHGVEIEGEQWGCSLKRSAVPVPLTQLFLSVAWTWSWGRRGSLCPGVISSWAPVPCIALF